MSEIQRGNRMNYYGADKDWGNKGDPLKDILKARDIMNTTVFEPARVLGTRKQDIMLEALSLYEAWKAKWRKDHPILDYLERVWNKIRGVRE